MKQKLVRLSQDYATGLRTHLQPGAPAGLGTARELGQQAAALGVKTLELARIHEQALVTLALSPNNNGRLKRAENYFTEANTPIAATHQAGAVDKVHLRRLKKTLGQRTRALATTHRQLQRGVDQRKVLQATVVKNGLQHKQSLEESLELQKRLRQLTHRVLATQEDERQSISQELHHEIAQTLLGINVRLLSLKQEARGNHQELEKDIATTRRLVTKSAQSVRRVAREFGRV
jgi:signal transduction histidine kinase